MPATRPTYTATFERAASGTWVVQLVEEPNVNGYGDTLVEARTNLRDAIATLFGPFDAGGDGFDLVEDVRLPKEVLDLVRQACRQRELVTRQSAEARAAGETAEASARQAVAVTRHAARLLVDHGGRMKAQADDGGLGDDVRLPDEVVGMVERAHAERQAARQQREAARVAQDAAAGASRQAVATNTVAARQLVDHCGLTVEEAADLLGLSPQRTRRLLTG